MGFENEWESFGHAETAVRTYATAIRAISSQHTTPLLREAKFEPRNTKINLGLRRQVLIFLGTTGAGEGIRTLDPNLGKVVLYP